MFYITVRCWYDIIVYVYTTTIYNHMIYKNVHKSLHTSYTDTDTKLLCKLIIHYGLFNTIDRKYSVRIPLTYIIPATV